MWFKEGIEGFTVGLFGSLFSLIDAFDGINISRHGCFPLEESVEVGFKPSKHDGAT